MFKSTAKRARKSIVIIWIVSCVIMIPQAIVMECSSLLPELTNKTSLFTVCDEHWGGQFSQIFLMHMAKKKKKKKNEGIFQSQENICNAYGQW